MNITHDMSNDLTEYDPESRQVDGPNPIENRISSSAARVPDIISCTSGITVQGRQLHSFAFTTDAAIIRNTNADAILAVYPFTGEPVITQALLTAAQAPLFVGVGGGTNRPARHPTRHDGRDAGCGGRGAQRAGAALHGVRRGAHHEHPGHRHGPDLR